MNPSSKECCKLCQTKWLLTKNLSQARLDNDKAKLEGSNVDSATLKAKRALAKKPQITNPTLIPKGADRDLKKTRHSQQIGMLGKDWSQSWGHTGRKAWGALEQQ